MVVTHSRLYSWDFGGYDVKDRELYLLPGEYVLVEVKLDLLVGNVDAELLERILLEVLEAKDVQDANVQTLVLLLPGRGQRKKESQKRIYYESPLLL